MVRNIPLKCSANSIFGFCKFDNVIIGLLTVALIALALVWPDDIPFINDEAGLISRAWNFNDEHQLASYGLTGTVGVPYGPLPTWFYQACLIFTRDLVTISVIKNGISIMILLLALLWWAREINFCRHPLLLTLASPYIYILHRKLWDDGFMVGLSVLSAPLLIRFLRTPSRRLFLAALLLIVVMIHIQLKSLFVILGCTFTVIIFEWRWLLANRSWLLIALAIAAMVSWPYGSIIIGHIHFPDQLKDSMGMSLVSGLMGIQYLSFHDWAAYDLLKVITTDFPFIGSLGMILRYGTYLSFVFFLAGVWLGLKSILTNTYSSHLSLSVGDKFTGFCLLTMAINMAFYLITRHHHLPHYYLSVWFVYYYFLWRCVNELWSLRFMRVVYKAYVFCLTASLVNLIAFIHVNGGDRSIQYGATLGNQLQVMRVVAAKYPHSKIALKVQNYRSFPHTFQLLRRIVEAENDFQADTGSVPITNYIVVDYDRSRPPDSGWIEVTIRDHPFDVFLMQPNE
jgi:hypothetical protein